VKSARTAGLTDGEIAEVLALTVLNIFTNYFNTAFRVDIDLPIVKALTTATQQVGNASTKESRPCPLS